MSYIILRAKQRIIKYMWLLSYLFSEMSTIFKRYELWMEEGHVRVNNAGGVSSATTTTVWEIILSTGISR